MKFLLHTLFSVLFGAATLAAQAEVYPARPVKIVVPFSPASSADNVARIIAEKFTVRFKQPFIVENRPGAGGTVGVTAVTKSPADGYTLLLTTSSPLVINPAIDKNVRYDVERDLVPVGLISSGALLLVSSPGFPANDLRELISLIKQNPGKYSYGSNGNGSYSHMAMELLKHMVGLDILHVPYKGPSQAEMDVIGGQINLMFDSTTTGSAFVKAGRLKSFGVSSRTIDPASPEHAPLAKKGMPALQDFDVIGWTGLLGPQNMPVNVTQALNAALRDLLADQTFRTQMLQKNISLVEPQNINDIVRLVQSEKIKWSNLAKATGIRLD